MKDGYLNFDEYIRQGEPAQREKAEAWRMAIGLQAVDGLKVSDYLRETAKKNIEGDISVDEAREMVKQYYITKTTHDEDDANKEEADKVSGNISKLLQTDSFTYSVTGFASIHRSIFEGVFKHAGSFRDYDISKKEWVLRGDSVMYGRWQDLRLAIEYDLDQERRFDYASLNKDQIIEHIARFISGLWQIHPFREGNTRTTALFTIKYIRMLGFSINNDLFANHSWYFRNALVRANYRNIAKGIEYEPVFLIRFFRNLLLGENNTLRNRYMMINPPEEWKMPDSELTTSTGQIQDKYGTSSQQVQDKFLTDDENIKRLVKTVGNRQMSLKKMMEGLALKGRDNFLNLYLTPALKEGWLRLLYPNSPRHPRQKYLLTIKGMSLYQEITQTED